MKNSVNYTPNSRRNISIFQIVTETVRNTYTYRDLISQLVKRDLFAIYRKSYLGIAWVLLSPFIAMISWILTYKTGILTPGDTYVSYPAYVLIGTFMWTSFLAFFNAGIATLSTASGFIHQVNYPHEILFFKQFGQQLILSMITLAVNIIILIAFGVLPSVEAIFFPILFIPLALLGASLGLIFSVISTVFQEIQRLFEVFWGLVFWVTPVIYSKDVSSDFLRKLIMVNPLSYLLDAPRKLLFLGGFDLGAAYWVSAGATFVLFFVALKLFYISERQVIEKML